MEISFIYTQILVHLHVNKTNFHTKGFALGLALKQTEAKGNWEIAYLFDFQNNFLQHFASLKPLKSSQTKLRSAVRTAAQSWLKLLVNLTWFTDGQQMVMKMPTAVDVLLELCQARHTKHVRDHALLVLRNLCFHGPSKPVLLANGECCGTVPQVKPYKTHPFTYQKRI